MRRITPAASGKKAGGLFSGGATAPASAPAVVGREITATFTVWTPIYVVTKEWVSYMWLCDAHVAAMRIAGWSCAEKGLRPGSLAPHPCQVCTALRRPISPVEVTNHV